MATSKKDYTEYDCKKLHDEINQIVSHRFQLTTLAVILFAGACGWLTQAVTGVDEMNTTLIGGVSILMIIVLSLLFIYSTLLLGVLRFYTTYLEHKFNSVWEKDWREYREDPDTEKYWGYSKASGVVFFVVGLLSFCYPLLLFWFATPNKTHRYEMPPTFWLALILLVAYLFTVVYVTKDRYTYFRKKLKQFEDILKSNISSDEQHICGKLGSEDQSSSTR